MLRRGPGCDHRPRPNSAVPGACCCSVDGSPTPHLGACSPRRPGGGGADRDGRRIQPGMAGFAGKRSSETEALPCCVDRSGFRWAASPGLAESWWNQTEAEQKSFATAATDLGAASSADSGETVPRSGLGWHGASEPALQQGFAEKAPTGAPTTASSGRQGTHVIRRCSPRLLEQLAWPQQQLLGRTRRRASAC